MESVSLPIPSLDGLSSKAIVNTLSSGAIFRKCKLPSRLISHTFLSRIYSLVRLPEATPEELLCFGVRILELASRFMMLFKEYN